MKHRLLIIALLSMVVTGIVGSPAMGQNATSATNKAPLTRKEKKELKKAEKKEHKQKKEEQSFAKPTTRAEKRKQRRELKHKQRQERKLLKKQQKLAKHKKVGVIVVGTPYPMLTQALAPPVVVKKRRELTYPHTQMKQRYRVDVLAPMYLDELVKDGSVTYKDKMPDKAVAGITFYEGVNMAADTLKKAGFNIDIFVHDVASAGEATDVLIKNGGLDSADLILGAVQAHDIPMLSDYAKRKHVNFVSVLSASDAGVRDNEYFTLMQPTLKTHCEWIDSDVAKKFPGSKPLLFYRTAMIGDSIAFRYMLSDSVTKNHFRPILCNYIPRRSDMVYLFDTSKPNLIVMPIFDYTYADSLLRQVSRDFPKVRFEVYGMPSWNGIPDLKNPYALSNMSVNVTSQFNVNTAEGVAKYVTLTFKKDYGGKATELAYRGYETMYWYANLLKKYGTIFNTNYTDNTAAPFTKFDMKTVWDKNDRLLYNENTHIILTKYEGGVGKIAE